MAVIKTFSFNNDSDYQAKIKDLSATKYRIITKDAKTALLKQRTFGSLFEHIFILIISFGIFNIPWAFWSRKKADEIKIILDETLAANTEEVDETFAKRKSEEKLWKIFLSVLGLLVVIIYVLAYLSNIK